MLILGLLGVLAAPAIFSMHEPVEELVLAIGMPLLAFFLFCNVFRVSRPLELMWAVVFVAFCTAAFRYRAVSLLTVAIASLAFMAIVIAIEMLRLSYHGVGWKFINPRLPAWWQEHAASNSVESDSRDPH